MATYPAGANVSGESVSGSVDFNNCFAGGGPHNWAILRVETFIRDNFEDQSQRGSYSHHVFYCTKCLAKYNQSM